MEDSQTAAVAAASKPAQAAGDASKGTGDGSSSTSSPSTGAAAEAKKQDYNTTSGVSESVQKQMDQGVDAAAASAMEYANYLSGQRTEGYGANGPARAPPRSFMCCCCVWCLPVPTTKELRAHNSRQRVLVRSWKD